MGKGTDGRDDGGPNDEDGKSGNKKRDEGSADDGDEDWDEDGGQRRVGTGPRTGKTTRTGAAIARGDRDEDGGEGLLVY